ncbi:MAG TPA: efflux RND transporter periplasmic adaptor subunit [Gemmatimonadales bacterium]|nr:efflux RND transporter periplasmic adaptor subunit [Gemmatimonadales bacterium]
MSRRVKLGLAGVIIVGVIGAVVALTAAQRNKRGTEVRLEAVAKRDLVATVTASGRIEAKASVDVTADITGRIVRIGVEEGDMVQKGQFLIQIDPAQYEAAVARAEAVVASSQAALVQTQATMDQAKRALDRARELRASSPNLVAQEAVEQAETSYQVAVANYNANRAQVEQARAALQEARENLAKTRIVAPMSGRVVRLPVEVGEVAVPGTFSRETALLMTIADLSTILAKVQVDETDVVRLSEGDSVEVTIDAFPDTTFVGRVTKISHSAQLTATQTASGSQDRAVDFDVEITLLDPPADIRPDLSCTAKIVTDTRRDALSIPIIALTVRENRPVPNERAGNGAAGRRAPVAGDTGRRNAKREAEGVFVVRGGIAQFRPVKVGIAGEEHFEVLAGLREGDTIVAGPYQAIRELKDSARVRPIEADTGRTGS